LGGDNIEKLEYDKAIYMDIVKVVVDGKPLTYIVEREFTGEKTFAQCLENIVKQHIIIEEQ